MFLMENGRNLDGHLFERLFCFWTTVFFFPMLHTVLFYMTQKLLLLLAYVLRQSITNLDHSMTIDNFARFHGKKWILTIWIFCANSLCSSKSIHCPTFHLLMKANELHRVASLPTFNYKGRFCKNHENVNQWQ